MINLIQNCRSRHPKTFKNGEVRIFISLNFQNKISRKLCMKPRGDKNTIALLKPSLGKWQYLGPPIAKKSLVTER